MYNSIRLPQNSSERFKKTTTAQNMLDDDIPIIPDMDDLQDEVFLNNMSEAPTVAVNRVETYKELTSELLRHAAFASLEDVDLLILTRCLQNESSLDEADVAWSWNKVFIDLVADIHADETKNADSG